MNMLFVFWMQVNILFVEMATTPMLDETGSSAGDITPVLDRKQVRFPRENSIGVEEKVPYLQNIQMMSDENI